MLYKNGTWVELKGERVREQAWQDIGHGSLISSVSREILPPWNFQPICFFSGKFQVIPGREYCKQFQCLLQSILLKAIDFKDQSTMHCLGTGNTLIILCTCANITHFWIQTSLNPKGGGGGSKMTHWSGECLSFLTWSCYGHKNSWLYP